MPRFLNKTVAGSTMRAYALLNFGDLIPRDRSPGAFGDIINLIFDSGMTYLLQIAKTNFNPPSCYRFPSLRMFTGTSLGCLAPGVLRPSAMYFFSNRVNRSTIFGCLAWRLVFSPGSASMS